MNTRILIIRILLIRMLPMQILNLSILKLLLHSLFVMCVQGVSLAEEPMEFFETKIRPVLVEHCYSCHSEQAKSNNKFKGGLLLDSRPGWELGGDSGAAIVPGEPAKGTLWLALTYQHDVQMPPAGKLPDEVLKDFERWIREGAVDPRDSDSQAARKNAMPDLAEAKSYWAFQTPQEHPIPKTIHEPFTKLDSFILAELQSQNLKPAPLAEPQVLIRRLYFDLIGLPPDATQVSRFLQNPTDESYRAIVDQLLASPAYGERWARLWLDVARYAEDQAHIVGEDKSLTYPNAYLYRQWIIQALNRDLSYSEFIRLQLAADLIEGDDSENLPALGFIGLGPKYYDRGKLFVMAEEWEDRVDVVSRGLLGLTVACARCHDHKFDPIPTEDYYGMAGVFASTQMFNKPLMAAIPSASAADDKASSDDQKKGDEPKVQEAKNPSEALHIVREAQPKNLNVFIRGDVNHKGKEVDRHFLSILSDQPLVFRDGSGRRELAEAIVSPNNPLTARVLVNRIWASYFGRGLVSTPSNFGVTGERPTHPDLLDDLAVRFVKNGSSLKWLHREIVLSRTYRQSSLGDVESVNIDPSNKWLSRMPRRRLGIEAYRDSLLFASGKLDTNHFGGSSIDPADDKQTRRTIYSRISRLELNRFLALYDFPDPNVSTEQRAETITPLQKLFVINSPFMLAQAQALHEKLWQRIPNHSSEDTLKRIDMAYQTLYGRKATEEEIELANEFLQHGEPKARWQNYVHALLAANEMQYID